MPLISAIAPLAARLIGNAADGKAGAEVAEQVATQVTTVAQRVFGAEDPARVNAAMQADPAKAAEFAREMNQLATQVQLATLQADLENVTSARAALTSETWWVKAAPGFLSLIITIGFFAVLITLISGGPPETTTGNQTVRELLALLLGALTLAFGDVRNFWLGSSAGSKKKDEALASQAERAMTSQSEQTRFVMRQIVAPAPARDAVARGSLPAVPASPAMRRQFPDGCGWRVTAEGVLAEGDTEPQRTVGEPVTVRRIWRDFGPLILEASGRIGVPAELVVATIATESRGNAKASRTEPDGRRSVGLMQTLEGTASDMLGRTVAADELEDPALSIEAGVRYIFSQRDKTDFQPPLVAASYNAGSLVRDEANRWKLRSTPNHIDRFCLFFNDTVFVAKADSWFR
ncbi:lytic transglycosylase domain-containing protein [Humitalea rosea]|uniref:lytic transglycosylase domain-containing protein n=1 Tax=Humitalea rosea TaxID=990373 RepID=UPI0013147FF1|nr:lytic transglycosylase domain-containing protein [Humitalea rosea]